MHGFLLSISPFFYFAAILFSVILSIQIIFRKDRQVFSNHILLAFLIINSYSILLFLFEKNGYLRDFWYLYKTAMPGTFLIPALVFLYLRSVIYNENRFKKYDWVHLLPTLLVILQYLPFYFSSDENKINVINALYAGVVSSSKLGVVDELLFLKFRVFVLTVYFFFLLHMLVIRFAQSSLNQIKPSQFTAKLKRWIKVFGYGYLINTVAILSYLSMFYVYPEITHSSLWPVSGKIIANLFNSTLILYSGYLLIWPETLIGFDFNNDEKSDSKKLLQKNSTPYDQDLKLHFKLISSVIEKNKLFLNPAVKIQDLAVNAGLPIRRASYVINTCFEGNFNQFVNQFRINEAIKKIENGYLNQFTLDSLYLKVGFANRSSFYAAFKEKTGLTPKQYAKLNA